MGRVRFIILIGVLLLGAAPSYSGMPDVFTDTTQRLPILKSVEVLTDSSGKLTFGEVAASANFLTCSEKVPNLGVTVYSQWVKFEIKNNTPVSSLLLELENSFIDTVELFSQDPDGNLILVHTGEVQRIKDRKYKNQNFIFKINIPPDATKTFYFRLRSGDLILVPLYLSTEDVYFEKYTEKDLFFAMYAGIIIVMILYNLFIYFIVKDRSYLFYVLYTLFIGLTQLALQGFTYKYFWPDAPVFSNQSLILFPCMAAIFAVFFIRDILNLKSFHPAYNWLLTIILVIYGMAILLRLGDYGEITFNVISYKIVDFSAGIFSFYFLFIAVIASVKNYRTAKFFLLAWSVFLVGVFIYVLRNFGILPYNTFTNYTMPLGNVIELVLLSFALADRINILKKEKEKSQQQALEALHEKERIMRQQNELLDQKVKERTEALLKSNLELNSAVKNLQDTQVRLVNAEKMALLVTAGVAHEINNPINFVASSIKPLRRDIEEMWSVLDRYSSLNPQNFTEMERQIRKYKEDLDMEYIREEIECLLTAIYEGAARTSEIVKGLTSFSRVDDSDLLHADLHEGIDSTLILLNSLFRNKILVERIYGDIPKVECYAGKLNQVFMNVISNALYAIRQKSYPDGHGKLTIKTLEEGEYVLVSIRDNGTGIPENIRSRIFEPFFTTKPVGEGTGLGLSIVYSIIEHHKGKINLVSNEGEGTEFIITLPKIQHQSQHAPIIINQYDEREN